MRVRVERINANLQFLPDFLPIIFIGLFASWQFVFVSRNTELCLTIRHIFATSLMSRLPICGDSVPISLERIGCGLSLQLPRSMTITHKCSFYKHVDQMPFLKPGLLRITCSPFKKRSKISRRHSIDLK